MSLVTEMGGSMQEDRKGPRNCDAERIDVSRCTGPVHELRVAHELSSALRG